MDYEATVGDRSIFLETNASPTRNEDDDVPRATSRSPSNNDIDDNNDDNDDAADIAMRPLKDADDVFNDDADAADADDVKTTPDSDYECDCFGASLPSCFDSLRFPRFALAILCAAATVQGFVCLGLINVVISTLETRFRLPSFTSGFIASSYALGQVAFVLPTTYFGGAGRKPRFLGIALLAIGAGSFIFSLPHFVGPSAETAADDAAGGKSLCHQTPLLSNLSSDDAVEITPISSSSASLTETLRSMRWLFYFGHFLNGAGTCCLLTLGFTYIDDNLTTAESARFKAIYMVFFVVGPAMGFLCGGPMLKIHESLESVESMRNRYTEMIYEL